MAASTSASKRRTMEGNPSDPEGSHDHAAASPLAPQSPTAKKRKRGSSTVESATSPSKRRKRQAKTSTKQTYSIVTPPPSPPLHTPALIAKSVSNKVDQIHHFVEHVFRREESTLAHDSENPALIMVHVLNLESALMRMQVHFEMGRQDDIAIANVKEAISHFVREQKPGRPIQLHDSPMQQSDGKLEGVEDSPVDLCEFVLLDLSKPTKFEQKIREKIAGHGLEDVGLLEMEMELVHRQLLSSHLVGSLDGEKFGISRPVCPELTWMRGPAETADGAATHEASTKEASAGENP